jgi:hypothetical protein
LVGWKENSFLHFKCYTLTPKGLNVCTADKPVLVSVTRAHTIFRFLETFCEDASCSKLRVKKIRIFWIYESKVMGVWSFKEKSRQGGHVLEPTSKSWPLMQKVEGREKKKFKKDGYSPIGRGVNPRPAGDRWLPESRRSKVAACWSAGRGLTPQPVGLYLVFWI